MLPTHIQIAKKSKNIQLSATKDIPKIIKEIIILDTSHNLIL
jgi:hypothetical protein